MNKDLHTYIETNIIPRYQHFDRAHDVTHVRTVIHESLALAKLFPEADEDMVYTIAAYHDTGLCEGRERHHLVSGQIIMADAQLRRWFTEAQCIVMKEAVEDHRASAQHEPRSLYGRIVAEADRQLDTDTVLRRTIQYGLAHQPAATKAEHYARTLQHLEEKFGPHGYLKLWIPQSSNAQRLHQLWALMDDEEALRSTFDRIWKEENEQG